MPDRMIDDVVSVLERFEELLEGLSDDGRVLFYARDLTRLVTWLRTQPRSRLVLGGLGAGVLPDGVHAVRGRRPAPQPVLTGPGPPPAGPKGRGKRRA